MEMSDFVKELNAVINPSKSIDENTNTNTNATTK